MADPACPPDGAVGAGAGLRRLPLGLACLDRRRPRRDRAARAGPRVRRRGRGGGAAVPRLPAGRAGHRALHPLLRALCRLPRQRPDGLRRAAGGRLHRLGRLRPVRRGAGTPTSTWCACRRASTSLPPRRSAVASPPPTAAWVERAGLRPGEWLAVHGCGGVGLSAVMIGAALGARVLAVDIADAKLALARELGAAATLDASTVDDVGRGGARGDRRRRPGLGRGAGNHRHPAGLAGRPGAARPATSRSACPPGPMPRRRSRCWT